jgi:N-acetylneuraminic acid mutarotase
MVLFLLLFTANLANTADDWTQQYPDRPPTARYGHAMAYAGGDHVLLFGGYSGGSDYHNDTWVYDLSEDTWTQQYPSSNPEERYWHAMAYIGGDHVLLFGGEAGGIWYGDTWVYDLSANTWTQQYPNPDPEVRDLHAMAHIGGDQVLLYGGHDNWDPYDDTWVYDLSANTWTRQYPNPFPGWLWGHEMAYIGGDQVLLLTGSNTWVYDLSANTWTRQYPSSSPSADDAMAYIGGDQVLVFGGFPLNDETWVYDLSDNTWTQDTNTTQPSPRASLALSETSMDGSSYSVLFGGQESFDSYFDDTWTFGGGDYLLLDPMVLDIELISASTARISWLPVTGATYYDLYRSTVAYFSGSGLPWQTVAAPTTQLDFTDGIGDTNTNYYFIGKARSDYLSSPESNTVGEFDFEGDIP